MTFSSRTNPSRKRSKASFDRRVDQWIATGRQFVDGVAGNRPGKRRLPNNDHRNYSDFGAVGRWIDEKMDWLLEEDDDWQESWQSSNFNNASEIMKKRPLEAISRRVLKESDNRYSMDPNHRSSEEWPDESNFQVQKWQRNSFQDKSNTDRKSNISIRKNSLGNRPLPRSNRRRN